MRRSGKIKKYFTRRYFRTMALKLKDFFTSETAIERSRNIVGLKEYKSEVSKIFAYTWRLSIAVFFIFTFAFGFNPFVAIEKTILALGGSEGSVELYASSCVSDYAVLDTDLGWWRERNAAGQASVGSIAGIGLFDNINSAVYNGGDFNLSCGDFQQAAATEEKFEEKDIMEVPAAPEALTATTTETAEEIAVATSSALEIKEDVIEATTTQTIEQATTTETQTENIVSAPAENATETIASETQPVEAQVIEPAAEAEPVIVEEVSASPEPVAEQPVEVIEFPNEAATAEVMTAPAESENIITKIFSPIREYIAKRVRIFMATAMGEKSLEEYGAFAGAKVKMSLAVTKKIQDNIIEESENPVMTVWYALDEASSSASTTLSWQELTTITAGEISNETNGGYLSLDIPGLKGWDDLKKVKVRLEGKSADNDYRAFIDSVWLEGKYENISEMKNDVTEADRERWKTMMDFVSGKDDFKMDERVDMRFMYKKNFRTLATIFDMTSYWADVNLTASLVDANGNAVGLPLTIIFEDDGYFNVRAIDMPREFRPGKYSVKFSIEDGSGVATEFIDLSHDFSWGVLAVNTNKSIYLPGESSYIQMAVLDDLGHTICDANLSMTITAPDGGVAELSTANGLIERNPECGPDNVISTPDYSAHYGVAGAGTYNISLTASTGNGDRTVTDKFEVRDTVPFDIERIGPTRIFPKADYAMTLKIKANEDYSGDIIETVPSSFKITNYELKITNIDNQQFVIRNSRFFIGEDGQQIIAENVNLKIGDEAELIYSIDFPDISPEFYLAGPLSIGSFSETRKWQIASDAVAYRAKTVQFMGGTYTGNGTTGQNASTNQSFSRFNFKLMENSITIKNAYVVLEAEFKAYSAALAADYTASNVTFDSCSGTSCGANAWTGTSSVATNDTTVIAYDESESNLVRILLDVTSEAQLAAYSGNGADMQAQIGYRLDRAANNDIGYAKAKLVITYTYDKNSSPNLTNTVIYPLESGGNGGTKATSTANNCTYNSTCPLFAYNMNIPEYGSRAGDATSTQWFQMSELNDANLANDVRTDVNIQGTDTNTPIFYYETSQSDQSTMPYWYFTNVSGYQENTAQSLEYHASTGAGTPVHYLIGGEIIETYAASSSAATKTNTVSFPIGVINNGISAATSTGSVAINFPENGTATGTVNIEKAWFRIKTSSRTTGSAYVYAGSQVGNNATSSITGYNYDPAATVIKPQFDIIHIIPASDYTELENANAMTAKTVTAIVQNSLGTTAGHISVELMITYTYTDDSKGYLSNLNLFAGQLMTNPSRSATSSTANLVVPEVTGKMMLAASMKASYLESSSDRAQPAANTANYFDVNIATANPSCTANTYRVPLAAYNIYAELEKSIPTSTLGTIDNTSFVSCYAVNDNNDANAGAKMNSILNYTYSWVNTPPTSTINSIVNRMNGTGIVDLMFTADDVDKDDLKGKLEYEEGTSCAFSSATKLTLDSTASSTYGTINIDNASAYQVGTGTNMIITSSGANTVEVDWPSKADLANVDNAYCVRLITNDGVYDQTVWATSTVAIDNLAPTDPGQLTATNIMATSTYIAFGATTTENHFAEYKIFYKVYDGTPVDELDTLISSTTVPDLGDINFNGATSTLVTLSAGAHYVFNIWAYDTFGNSASSTQIDFSMNNLPTGTFNSASQKTNGSGRVDVSFTADDPDNDDTLRAKIEYEAGSSCAFLSATKATIDQTQENISSTFGIVNVDNSGDYQVGTSTGWIITSPGANTISVDWLTKNDVPSANGAYCLRLTVNDGNDDQLVATTTILTIDNTDPTAPGALSDGGRTINSINLAFGATSTDSNFSLYKVYYKVGISGVTESDTPVSDGNLNDVNFNGATSTLVSGLNSNTDYVFNIWAYDQNGNEASSTEVTIKTNASISNDSLTFTDPESSNIAIGNGSSEYNFRAVVTELSGWHVIASTTLRLANSSDNTSPFDDLVFKWDESTESFSEIGTDVLNAVEISPNSTSTCSVNTCTLDFKVKFNFNFATSSTNYNAELISSNDSAVTDDDIYNNVYQVKTIKVSQTHYRWRNDNGGN